MSTKWWFTFGQGSHERNYVVIKGSYGDARHEMAQRFGALWCGQYSTAEDAGVEKYCLKNLDHQVDNEFLKKLVEMAREYGYAEVRNFVQHCFIEANKTPPTDGELKPL